MKQQRENSGVLFKNDKRQTESHPHYTGSIRVNGKDYWISAWIKEGDNGKFMSLAVNPKDKERPTTSKRGPAPTDDDSLPPF